MKIPARSVGLCFTIIVAAARTQGEGLFPGPEQIDLGQSAVFVAIGRFSASGDPGLAAVHGNQYISVLLPDPWRKISSIQAGIGLFYIRAADLDGDGLDDLAVADPGAPPGSMDPGAFVALCLGDGTFTKPVSQRQTEGSRAIIPGDWDGDGSLDLATVNHPDGTVTIFMGSGDGTFAAGTKIEAGAYEHNHDLDSFDHDGDGILDLALAVDFQGIQTLRGDGDGGFRPVSIANFSDEPSPRLLFCGATDLNGDGLGDLMAMVQWGVGLTGYVALGDGTGSFVRTASIMDFSCTPARADLDGDGVIDIIGTSAQGTTVDLLPGRGDGTFLTAVRFESGAGASVQVLAADGNGDGGLDLVISDGRSPSVILIPGREGGGLEVACPITGYGTGRAMAIGDLDGDRMPDLLVASGSSRIDVFLQPGKARPGATPSFSIPLSKGSYASLAAADLDGDGTLDLAGTGSTGGTALIAMLDGAGKVRTEAALPAGTMPGPVVVGLIDGDRLPDLVVPCAGPGHAAVFLNLGEGRFAEARTVPTVAKARRCVLAGIDADGALDLSVISDDSLAVHWGDGTGGFSGPATLIAATERSFASLAAADIDGDGRPDLAAADGAAHEILIFPGKDGRTFGAPGTIPLGRPPTFLDVADLDGDGLSEIVFTASDNSATVLLNRGAAGFEVTDLLGLGFRASGLAVADLDRDGSKDLVAFGSQQTDLIFGRPPAGGAFRRGDADGDGAPSLTDAVVILSTLFLGAGQLPCSDAADANDDGSLDLTDPIAILTRLFLGGAPLPPPGDCGGDPTADSLAACGIPCR